ncbi:hypothetical protein DACRYDRAFT_21502 [Dacryopinax primogenitus]|uniref:Uncharacterized protein n=1 Tax=Dacryopinax primogenitus (strain DJM 731) TaxID=1858805 RepID=M5G3M8_DACPD|nr:uncharacterized protein DACRYDRAFT_21502 [Dacryopinax primogenitus]EJU03279.1 hypothetical protein DACRYDRAFT_21502 [Dacryopinax primogenitus]
MFRGFKVQRGRNGGRICRKNDEDNIGYLASQFSTESDRITGSSFLPVSGSDLSERPDNSARDL